MPINLCLFGLVSRAAGEIRSTPLCSTVLRSIAPRSPSPLSLAPCCRGLACSFRTWFSPRSRCLVRPQFRCCSWRLACRCSASGLWPINSFAERRRLERLSRCRSCLCWRGSWQDSCFTSMERISWVSSSWWRCPLLKTCSCSLSNSVCVRKSPRSDPHRRSARPAHSPAGSQAALLCYRLRRRPASTKN